MLVVGLTFMVYSCEGQRCDNNCHNTQKLNKFGFDTVPPIRRLIITLQGELPPLASAAVRATVGDETPTTVRRPSLSGRACERWSLVQRKSNLSTAIS